MIQGSTPTLYLKVNNIEDLSSIKDIRITILPYGKNNGSMVKTLDDDGVEIINTADEKAITLKLTQKETLLIYRDILDIQYKVLLDNDDVLVSDIFKINSGLLLDRTLMGEETGGADGSTI